ncbi:UvrB/UvrC motif-containing protein [Ruminococcaceae bacterium OttesenSCG-928-L11]|nr:UvrB/UvrC motif-containing protein [Ruminococcaceae bacterium OttesenSCG-928-L11]
MKCFNCNQNEADQRFFVNYMGNTGEIHLCSHCVEQFQQMAGSMFQNPAAWGPYMANPQFFQHLGMSVPPQMGFHRNSEINDAAPIDAGDALRNRRRLNELRAKMNRAAAAEDYEAAATLRDEIARFQQKIREGDRLSVSSGNS